MQGVARTGVLEECGKGAIQETGGKKAQETPFSHSFDSSSFPQNKDVC